ncbi:hypothetical protein KKJ01_18215 [Xenorhabdus bovienii]|uniref:DNA-damage-inducible protein J n=1 Tax=Xenorhabdus bovienii TaxID=40576 RepID=A0AAJ1N6K4_XENBV|nr:hypothetical protein [Xenorhabdus bovienii]MDE1480101.1 hypothetical protein [Xenorhabdus bovienii]MDE1491748.1 hypothetical protein [Xenorhabdus bovienii]MDE9511797.1 hypothetical protein [Xenorhabdus bovienii]MDE9523430.1 hypothetical protein [Xenorhabdus bovienii]
MNTKRELIAAKIDINLKNAFIAIAQSKHRPVSQILRDLIRMYVESNQVPNAETLETFKKTDQGEDIFFAKNASDLFKQLDI